MTTVRKRETASDNGFQLTDGYHVVMFSSAAAAVPLRPTTTAHQLIDAIRVVGATLVRLPRATTLPPFGASHGERRPYSTRAVMSCVSHPS
jgi:hypothetical protein